MYHVVRSYVCICKVLWLSPFYHFGNGYVESLSWLLKTQTGIGTQLSRSRPVPQIRSYIDSLKEGKCWYVGYACGTRLVQLYLPRLIHTPPVLQSHQSLPPQAFCSFAYVPFIHNIHCLSWDQVTGFVLYIVSIVYYYVAGPTFLLWGGCEWYSE